jgi:hypothetical protein
MLSHFRAQQVNDNIAVIHYHPAGLTAAFYHRVQSGFGFNNFTDILSQAVQHSFTGAVCDHKGVRKVRDTAKVKKQNIFCKFVFKYLYDLAS